MKLRCRFFSDPLYDHMNENMVAAHERYHSRAPKRPVRKEFRHASGVSYLRYDANRKGTTNAVPFLLAWHEGFEPPTFWFVAKHSIRLS